MKSLGFLALGAALAAASLPASAADQQPLRHLVYNFTVGVTQTNSIHSSGIDNGATSGVTDYGGGESDKGTISVDVLQASPDGGLVVKVSEQARNTRSAPAAMCAAYGITGVVICDQSVKVNEEEMALLQVIGRDFVDPTQFDANRHWHRGQSTGDASESDDYTAGPLNNGVMNITMQRVTKVEGAQGYNVVTDGTVTYNLTLSIPTHLTQDAILRSEHGMGQNNRIETKIDMALATDSMQTAKTP